jgi:hypothetical protein
MYFFVEKQLPLSFTNLLLAEFTDLKACQSTLASIGLDYSECTDRSRQFDFSDSLPD